MMDSQDKTILFDGLDPVTGRARLGPVSPVAAGRRILRRRQTSMGGPPAVPKETPKGFAERWGLVCTPGLDPATRDALDPLLQARNGVVLPYRGELDLISWMRNLQKEGGPFPDDCLYLLLVGSPQEIPFDFQKMLTPQYLVGRLCLPNADGYDRYVQTILGYEKGDIPVRRTDVEFYAPDDTPQTLASRQDLVEPLIKAVRGTSGYHALGWIGGEASREQAVARMQSYRDEAAPAVTFLVSHGAEVSGDLRAQFQGSWIPQGALNLGVNPPAEEMKKQYLTGDLFASGELSPYGSVVFNFSCFGAGLHQEFTLQQWILEGEVKPDDPNPFVSALGQGLLGNPHPALAYISTLDRKSNVFSLLPRGIKPFQDWLESVLDGVEVGLACQALWEWKSTLKEGAEQLLEQALSTGKTPETLSEDEAWDLGLNWIMGYELENVVLLGDPAARLGPLQSP